MSFTLYDPRFAFVGSDHGRFIGEDEVEHLRLRQQPGIEGSNVNDDDDDDNDNDNDNDDGMLHKPTW
ncbi:hypothetical protein K490DRAFT_65574 [Saccharata proteae CBS 121410]|uniref:Uncharacterized protein n=1 Tax=Saccharata proteae CBS 121410 TaxID=1314787 RepID=A0A9P4M0B1_9PEZI|nr:hypothetical protein K490DRAFT_65574 [Saccharata proteae CBS 121410]